MGSARDKLSDHGQTQQCGWLQAAGCSRRTMARRELKLLFASVPRFEVPCMILRLLRNAMFATLVAGQALGAIVATDVRVGQTYAGACDASAAAAIDDDRFVIASDEMGDDDPGRANRLHVHRRGVPPPVSQLDLTPAVQHPSLPTHPDSDKRESDFEGAARLENRIFCLEDGRLAVLVPLLNANALVDRTATRARFGDPIHLDLGSRGIRDIAYWKAADAFIIIAGAPGDAENFALFAWTGTSPPTLLKDDSGRIVSLHGQHPESLVLLESGELLVLSDDGDEPAAGLPAKANKDVPSRQRTFRTLSMKLVSR
ncbi:MAG TPA: hypothetical protein VJ276_18180 [Thermoanaerobaculia bacterium]|nr:hypothetical protein [Thermoanaerobaculia bacterium]